MVDAIGNDATWAYADAGSLGVSFTDVKRHVEARSSDRVSVQEPNSREYVLAEIQLAMGKQKHEKAQAIIGTAEAFTTMSPAVSQAMYADARQLIDASIHHRANHAAIITNEPYEVGYTQALSDTFASGIPASLVRNEPLIAAFNIQSQLDTDVPLDQIVVFDGSRQRYLSTDEITEFATWDGETEIKHGLYRDVPVQYGDRVAIQRLDGEVNTKITQEWVWNPSLQDWETGATKMYWPEGAINVSDPRNPENSTQLGPAKTRVEPSADEIMQDHYDPEGNYNSYPNSLPPNYESNIPRNFDGYPDTDALPDAISSFFGFPGYGDIPSNAGSAYTIIDVAKALSPKGDGLGFSTFAVPVAVEALEWADQYDGKPTVEGPNPANMFNGLPHDRTTRHLYADN